MYIAQHETILFTLTLTARPRLDSLPGTKISPYTHAPSALCAHSVQSDAAALMTIERMTVQTRKRTTDDDADDDKDKVTEGDERTYSRMFPAKKRTHRYTRVAVQTVVAVVIRTVAAWSILAFVRCHGVSPLCFLGE